MVRFYIVWLSNKNMKKIKLTKGKYALVDDSSFEFLSQWSWYAKKDYLNTFYAARTCRLSGRPKTIRMHRFIVKCPKNKQVDHVNRDKLDNRIDNLRICSSSQNTANKGLNSTNKSGYKGVHWNSGYNKWAAQIKTNKKIIHLGYFEDKTKAAEAYNKMAIKIFKSFAFINKI